MPKTCNICGRTTNLQDISVARIGLYPSSLKTYSICGVCLYLILEAVLEMVAKGDKLRASLLLGEIIEKSIDYCGMLRGEPNEKSNLQN